MFQPVNGATLAYDIAGRGPTVFLIGGGGTLDRRMWDDQWAALTPRFSVVRYDVRGIGGSSAADAPFSHSDDLHALIRSLAREPVFVVGLSFGAGIAIDLALDRPDVVKGLVLAAPGLSNDKDQNVEGALAVAALAREKGLPFVAEAMVTNRTLLAAASDSVRLRVKANYLDNAGVFDSDFALVRLWRPTSPPAVGRLSAIRAATLILIGDQDSAEGQETADKLAASIRGSTKVVIDGAGHLLNVDAPERFNQALTAFLSRAAAMDR
jgi:pimeloyl-ACP methyl ester carboxylesterase